MDLQTNHRKKNTISRLLEYDSEMAEYLLESFSYDIFREEPELLLAEFWDLNAESRILVRAAMDIWDGRGNVFLSEILCGLSKTNFERFLIAMHECKDLRWPDLQSTTPAPTPPPRNK